MLDRYRRCRRGLGGVGNQVDSLMEGGLREWTGFRGGKVFEAERSTLNGRGN